MVPLLREVHRFLLPIVSFGKGDVEICQSLNIFSSQMASVSSSGVAKMLGHGLQAFKSFQAFKS